MAVLMNEAAGSIAGKPVQQSLEYLTSLFAAQGVAAEAKAFPGKDLPEAAQAMVNAGHETLVVGGGDGSVGSVAGMLKGTEVVLGVLPVGTYNHFARDLGVPMELEDAVAALAAGSVHEVDVGEVNGISFVNASSIGAYPRAVAERERLRACRGWTKQLAMPWAAAKVLLSRPAMRVELDLEGRPGLRCTTPFLFVGNNTYALGVRAGELRSTLNSGVLSIYIARGTGLWTLARLVWKAFWGRLEDAEEFVKWKAPEARVMLRQRAVRVAVDGEVRRLIPPLNYRIHTGALRVIMPANHGTGAHLGPALRHGTASRGELPPA